MLFSMKKNILNPLKASAEERWLFFPNNFFSSR